jgi:hypothetical protein
LAKTVTREELLEYAAVEIDEAQVSLVASPEPDTVAVVLRFEFESRNRYLGLTTELWEHQEQFDLRRHMERCKWQTAIRGEGPKYLTLGQPGWLATTWTSP